MENTLQVQSLLVLLAVDTSSFRSSSMLLLLHRVHLGHLRTARFLLSGTGEGLGGVAGTFTRDTCWAADDLLESCQTGFHEETGFSVASGR